MIWVLPISLFQKEQMDPPNQNPNSFFMYSSRPGLLFGFHGCEQSVRDNIVSGRAILKPSINGYDWLGVGSIQLKPFDSVRSLFVEGEELYPGAGFHEKNHIQ